MDSGRHGRLLPRALAAARVTHLPLCRSSAGAPLVWQQPVPARWLLKVRKSGERGLISRPVRQVIGSRTRPRQLGLSSCSLGRRARESGRVGDDGARAAWPAGEVDRRDRQRGSSRPAVAESGRAPRAGHRRGWEGGEQRRALRSGAGVSSARG